VGEAASRFGEAAAPLLALTLTAAAVIAAAGGIAAEGRVLAVGAFLVVGPGLAIASALGIQDKTTVLAVVPASSIALAGLFSTGAIYLSLAFPEVPLVLLALVTAAASFIGIVRRLRSSAGSRTRLLTRRLRPPQGSPSRPSGDAATSAREVTSARSLRFGDDSSPGIARLASGATYRYVHPNGSEVRDAATVARIDALAIPPSWEGVWISPDADTHVQATGRDLQEKRRRRTIYHPNWAAVRKSEWFGLAGTAGRSMTVLRRRIAADQSATRPSTDLLCAWLVRAVITPLEIADPPGAPGGAPGAQDWAALEWRAPVIIDLTQRGNEHAVAITPGDPVVSRIANRCTALGGQPLLRWWAEGGIEHDIESGDLNRYVRRATRQALNIEHVRSWVATVLLGARLPSDNRSSRTAHADDDGCLASVAAILDRDPFTVISQYVHPAVRGAHARGVLPGLGQARVDPDRGRVEVAVLALLAQFDDARRAD
jgi:DNA topoisomerase-1